MSQGQHRERKRGLFVPEEIVSAKDMTPAQKLVWARVNSFTVAGCPCWESAQTMADHLGLCRDTVEKSQRKLKAAGLLEVRYGNVERCRDGKRVFIHDPNGNEATCRDRELWARCRKNLQPVVEKTARVVDEVGMGCRRNPEGVVEETGQQVVEKPGTNKQSSPNRELNKERAEREMATPQGSLSAVTSFPDEDGAKNSKEDFFRWLHAQYPNVRNWRQVDVALLPDWDEMVALHGSEGGTIMVNAVLLVLSGLTGNTGRVIPLCFGDGRFNADIWQKALRGAQARWKALHPQPETVPPQVVLEHEEPARNGTEEGERLVAKRLELLDTIERRTRMARNELARLHGATGWYVWATLRVNPAAVAFWSAFREVLLCCPWYVPTVAELDLAYSQYQKYGPAYVAALAAGGTQANEKPDLSVIPGKTLDMAQV